MSFVYEVTAQMTEFEPETGGFPLGGTGAVVNAFGEDRVVRIFSEDRNIVLDPESGVRIFDTVREEFVEPGFTGGARYIGQLGDTVYFFITAEVAFNEANPVAGERIAYGLSVEGEPFVDIPDTEGIDSVDRVATNLGFNGVGSVTSPPYTRGEPFPLDDVVGEFLGETGQGLTVAQARNIALLYETGLDRDGVIDLPGLNFWIDARENGFSNGDIAAAFTRSPEFEASFGPLASLTDAEYVDLLYENTLGRAGDAPGVAFWNEQLADGFSREGLLFAFATSVENQDTLEFVNTITEIGPSDWAFIG